MCILIFDQKPFYVEDFESSLSPPIPECPPGSYPEKEDDAINGYLCIHYSDTPPLITKELITEMCPPEYFCPDGFKLFDRMCERDVYSKPLPKLAYVNESCKPVDLICPESHPILDEKEGLCVQDLDEDDQDNLNPFVDISNYIYAHYNQTFSETNSIPIAWTCPEGTSFDRTTRVASPDQLLCYGYYVDTASSLPYNGRECPGGYVPYLNVNLCYRVVQQVVVPPTAICVGNVPCPENPKTTVTCATGQWNKAELMPTPTPEPTQLRNGVPVNKPPNPNSTGGLTPSGTTPVGSESRIFTTVGGEPEDTQICIRRSVMDPTPVCPVGCAPLIHSTVKQIATYPNSFKYMYPERDNPLLNGEYDDTLDSLDIEGEDPLDVQPDLSAEVAFNASISPLVEELPMERFCRKAVVVKEESCGLGSLLERIPMEDLFWGNDNALPLPKGITFIRRKDANTPRLPGGMPLVKRAALIAPRQRRDEVLLASKVNQLLTLPRRCYKSEKMSPFIRCPSGCGLNDPYTHNGTVMPPKCTKLKARITHTCPIHSIVVNMLGETVNSGNYTETDTCRVLQSLRTTPNWVCQDGFGMKSQGDKLINTTLEFRKANPKKQQMCERNKAIQVPKCPEGYTLQEDVMYERGLVCLRRSFVPIIDGRDDL